MSGAPRWTVASVHEALLAKKTSARELAQEFYAQIEQRNPELNAFLTLCPTALSSRPTAWTQPWREESHCLRWPAYPLPSKT